MRKQLNRYTQRELEVIVDLLENFGASNAQDLVQMSALAKSKLRLRREKERAK